MDAENVQSAQEVDDTLTALTTAIQEADRVCIPRRRKQFGIFGLTPEILSMIGPRRAATRGWQRWKDPALRQRVRFLNVQIRNAIQALVNRNFGRAVQRLNDNPGPHGRKFWKMVRNLRRRPAAIPTIQSADGPLVTAAEKCDALASHYRDIAGDLPLRHGPVSNINCSHES